MQEHKETYSNGHLHKTYSTLNGKLEGKSIERYNNGTIQCEENYNNDLLEGEYRWYYANGQLGELFNYKQNQKHGPFELRHSNGILYAKGYYAYDVQYKTEDEANQAILETSFVW